MRLPACAVALVMLVLSDPALAAAPVAGMWRTEDKTALVRIGDCGASVCGKVAKFLVAPPQGVNQRDVNNPDRDLRQRKLLGLSVLSGFHEDGDLWRGRVYDPKSGRSYRSVMRRIDADRLEVKGCIGPICKTRIWRKAG